MEYNNYEHQFRMEVDDMLKAERRERLFQAFNHFKDPAVCTSMLNWLKKTKQQEAASCPHCKSSVIVRYGMYRDRQRYICKSCSRTFNDFTATPLHGTHYPHKWVKYVQCLIEGHSLYHTAEFVGISCVTAFYWRHKLISALQRLAVLKITPPENVYPYVCVRQNPPLEYMEKDEYKTFVPWIRSFDWIARKYVNRYISWFRSIQQIESQFQKLQKNIEQMLIWVCSNRASQTYKTVTMVS